MGLARVESSPASEDAWGDGAIVVPAPFAGRLDIINNGLAEGWAFSPENADRRVRVELWADGQFLSLGFADLFRRDLLRAGVGDGRHAFRIPLPADIEPGRLYNVSARVAGEDHVLEGGPIPFVATMPEATTEPAVESGAATHPDSAANFAPETGPYVSAAYLRDAYPDFYGAADEDRVRELFWTEGQLLRHIPSPLFARYLACLRKTGFVPPIRQAHWLHGERTSPGPAFDPYIYALAAISSGIAETILFSPAYYLQSNADVAQAGLNPHHHFIEDGYREPRKCSASHEVMRAIATDRKWFDPDAPDTGPEGKSDRFNTMLVEWNRQEHDGQEAHEAFERATSGSLDSARPPAAPEHASPPEPATNPREPAAAPTACDPGQFDAEYYLETQPDVLAAGVDPYWHYVNFGEREGRKPNPVFSPTFYLDLYGDVRASGMSALAHYNQFGKAEGRVPTLPDGVDDVGRNTILFVGHDAYAAGAQTVLLEVINWFRKHTYYSIRILLLGPGQLTSKYAKLGKCFTVNDIQAESGYIIEKFLQKRPDVVYCNTVASGALFASPLGDFLSGSKVISHCHELARILKIYAAELELLKARTDQWVCASPAITEHLVKSEGLDPERTTTVPAFIAPKDMTAEERARYRDEQRDALGIPRSAVVVAGCGTLDWRKDPRIFVETGISILKSRKQRGRFVFMWMGGGELLDELRAEVEKAGLGDAIKLIGHRTDAAELVAIADIFFMSSVEDPFPLVVLEAAQFGIPALCFRNATGMESFIGAGCGVIVEQRTAEAAAAAILKLGADASLRAQMGGVAQEAVRARYVPAAQMPFILGRIYEAGVPPGVSVIVPNYNHEAFIDQRIRSILDQTHQDFELIILDDCSTDASRDRIADYASVPRVRVVLNEQNSGSVFAQWKKGATLARSELIWIAESDDFCDEGLLRTLCLHLQAPDVAIAFCETEIVNRDGEVQQNALRPYLDRLSPGFGTQNFTVDGARFVNQGYGALSVIVNASGAVMRKACVLASLPLLDGYKMCGDWIVYLECCRAGSVAYDRGAKNYFRRHGASTVHKVEGTDQYFRERLAVYEHVLERFSTTQALRRRMQSEIRHEAERFAGRFDARFGGDIGDLLRSPAIRDYVDQRIHVCFYVHGFLFSKGGIERLFAMISAALIDRGYRVSVVCKPLADGRPVYAIRQSVQVVEADIETVEGNALLRQHLVDGAVSVFVPMLSESLFEQAIGAAQGLGIPIIASEHNDPWVIEERWWTRESRERWFGKCDAIHLLTGRFRDSLPLHLRPRARIVPNPVTPEFLAAGHRPVGRPRLIAAGRLAEQKRFDLLIEGFAAIAPEFPEWELVIFGDGPLRAALAKQVADCGMAGRISLPGNTERLAQEMATSEIFVLSSEFEGLPLTVIEAMAAGIPVVAFKDCTAAADLIRDGERGFLADALTGTALASKLRQAMTSPAERAEMANRARRHADRFQLDGVAEAWEGLIRSVCD